ncbi:retrotransposon protein, putative, ty1-copia subclass [Tanacetum coccineum]
MDGIVHTYKACLVAKGFTQLYRVDYEETFSPVADIRAIRILIAIAAFQQNPGEPHCTAVKTILKYLRNTKDMFLVYGINPEGAVDYKSSKQSTIVMSATVVEYIDASKAEMEAVWIRKFISGLGIVPTINEPNKMFCDNSTALLIANEPGVQRGARHYHRRYLLNVHTDYNLADPFTKALPKGKLT